ncbi:MAG: type II secretion system F family protein [Elusimicrobia bacterium]|nr:type II secretion system F family protein [Elusimicrobiota bacterium]MDE2426212.1 type II secretion system F family protein [Elusimicrobiota bacterium]
MTAPWVHYLLLVIGVLGSVAAYTAVNRLFAPPVEDEGDLSKLAKKEAGMTTAFSSLNPKGSLIDRLDLFLLRTFHLDVRIEELYMLMGRPAKPSPLEMLHMKEMVAVVLAAVMVYVSGVPALGLLGLAGFMLPDSIFKSRIKARQFEIMTSFPTFVDLTALTIEAGLDYMSAIERILKNSKSTSQLEIELQKTVNEIQLGYSRKDALKRLALRTGVQEIRSFVGLIIQSDELGTSLVELLRSYAADMRFRRLNKAEKLAAQASTKMLIPLFIFIFPTVFILMLSPMLKSFMHGGLGF